jgi:DNA-binding transcriptional regulator YiaG
MADVYEITRKRLDESRAKAPTWTTADRIRKIRRIQHLTQDQFAEIVEVAPGTLRTWEAGTSEPKRSDLVLLAVRCQTRFDVPAWWTLGEGGPADPLNDDDPQVRATARELLHIELVLASQKLPRMDSNHQPAGYLFPQVSGRVHWHTRELQEVA